MAVFRLPFPVSLPPFSSSPSTPSTIRRTISISTTHNPHNRNYHNPLPISAHSTISDSTSGLNHDDQSSKLDNFCQWLRDKGGAVTTASLATVKPQRVPEGLGLVAQKDIARNQAVVEVPRKLWIDPDTVAASEIGNVCSGLKPWASVALFLLREKSLGSDSTWKPYLDILPQFTDSTIFWSEEELLEIKGTQLLSTTIGLKNYVQSEFAKIESDIILANEHLFPQAITWSDFLWAFGILRSRSLPRVSGENLALIPLADLINHSPSITADSSFWDIKAKGIFSREVIFSLRTPAYVKAGQQVYIHYGLGKSNSDLAIEYGFIDIGTDLDAYTLTLQISESDPFYGDKLDIAESNGLGETATFNIVLGSPLPPLMLPYLRLVALGGTDAFLLEAIFRNSVWDHLQLPVSPDNEETICHVIEDACKSALSAYHTTIDQDEKLIEGGKLDPRAKIAIGVRMGEKKVLQHIIDTISEIQSQLDVLEYYQERRLKDLGLVGEQGEIIFWEK